MDFEYFGLSRDLLYLGSLLAGAVAAAFIVMHRRDCTSRQKSALLAVIFFLLSCIIALLAAAVILTGGLIFSVHSIYPFIVLFCIFGGAALYFPRAGGLALILAAGTYIILMFFVFLSIPGFNKPADIAFRSSGNELIIKRDAETWNIRNNRNLIQFEAAAVTVYSAFPLFGGERRGFITRAVQDTNELVSFARTKNISGGLKKSPGFLHEEFVLVLPLELLPRGITLSVLFDGKRLYFYPPLEL